MHSTEIINQVTAAIIAGNKDLAKSLIINNNVWENDFDLGLCISVAMTHGQCVFARELLLKNPHAIFHIRIDRNDPKMKDVPNVLKFLNNITIAQQWDQTYLIMRQADQYTELDQLRHRCTIV